MIFYKNIFSDHDFIESYSHFYRAPDIKRKQQKKKSCIFLVFRLNPLVFRNNFIIQLFDKSKILTFFFYHQEYLFPPLCPPYFRHLSSGFCQVFVDTGNFWRMSNRTLYLIFRDTLFTHHSLNPRHFL